MSSEDEIGASRVSERRAKTRERLIEAAAQAVAEKGFSATSLDAIAAKAGLTKGAIYDNFASKEELFLALIGHNVPQPEWPTERRGTARQRLRKLAKFVVSENEATLRKAPLRAEFLLYALTHPSVRERIPAFFAEQLGVTQQRIERLFSPGELILPPRELAILLENFIPSLAYTRSWSPDIIREADVIAIFESFAR